MKVYALMDPRDGTVRYVGCTAAISARTRSHLCRQSGQCATWPLYVWIDELRTLGLSPRVVTLENVPIRRDAFARERHWIEFYRDMGASLFNRARYLPVR